MTPLSPLARLRGTLRVARLRWRSLRGRLHGRIALALLDVAGCRAPEGHRLGVYPSPPPKKGLILAVLPEDYTPSGLQPPEGAVPPSPPRPKKGSPREKNLRQSLDS